MIFKIKFLFPFFLITCLLGCAGPDIVSSEKENNEVYSNAETREIFIDNPAMISGDYFRKRTAEPETNLGEILSSWKKDKTQNQNLNEKIALIEKDVASLKDSASQSNALPQAETQANTQVKKKFSEPADDRKKQQIQTIASDSPELKVKTGFLFNTARVSRKDRELVIQSAARLEAAYPVVLVDHDQIYETLAVNQQFKNKDIKKISEIVTLYPGIRILVLVDSLSLPRSFPGTAEADIFVVDAGLFYRYQPLHFKMPLKTRDDVLMFALHLADTAFQKAVKSSQVSPWFCRVFSSENDTFFINAGQKTGLKKGDTLKISRDAKVVKSSDGIPAGWIPGRIEGILKVDQFFGSDYAACLLMQGKAPQPTDCLIK